MKLPAGRPFTQDYSEKPILWSAEFDVRFCVCVSAEAEARRAVYGGACVTLTYKLRHSSPQAAASNKRAAATGAEGSHVRELCTAMEAALSDSVFMPGGGILGVPCFHMFNNEVFPAGGNNNMPLTLKQDAQLDVQWALNTPSTGNNRSNVMKKSMPANPDPSRPPLVAIGDYSATGYFGNDASIATFYTWAGFLVMVPPTGQGVRAALADAA
eukprot:jgi/Tetstr1/424366/TSEL_014928.t1